MPLFPKLSIPQVGFQHFETPVGKSMGGSPYAAMTAQRQGMRMSDIQGTAEKGAEKSGLKSLLAKGY